jgi:hypothetical protein
MDDPRDPQEWHATPNKPNGTWNMEQSVPSKVLLPGYNLIPQEEGTSDDHFIWAGFSRRLCPTPQDEDQE